MKPSLQSSVAQLVARSAVTTITHTYRKQPEGFWFDPRRRRIVFLCFPTTTACLGTCCQAELFIFPCSIFLFFFVLVVPEPLLEASTCVVWCGPEA
jgi:hypothetical protein